MVERAASQYSAVIGPLVQVLDLDWDEVTADTVPQLETGGGTRECDSWEWDTDTFTATITR